jgi:hypothetical protein
LKKILQIISKNISKFIVKILSLNKFGNFFLDNIIQYGFDRKISILHEDIKMTFYIPNSLCHWRVKTFSTKEPETLEWIENFRENSCIWDVGANIGLYSIYSGLLGHKVFCFEPSFSNLEILAKNIDLNNLQNNITILPIALNDKSKISELNLSDFKWGAAHSVFEKKFGWDGKDINTALSYRTLGFSIDDVSKYLKMLPPDYIKVDVDGIENLVLSGGVNTIDKAKSVLIEITKNFQSQSLGVKNILENLDFQLINEFKTSEYSYNQIWNKKI